jgi:hypothetical protein
MDQIISYQERRELLNAFMLSVSKMLEQNYCLMTYKIIKVIYKTSDDEAKLLTIKGSIRLILAEFDKETINMLKQAIRDLEIPETNTINKAVRQTIKEEIVAC